MGDVLQGGALIKNLVPACCPTETAPRPAKGWGWSRLLEDAIASSSLIKVSGKVLILLKEDLREAEHPATCFWLRYLPPSQFPSSYAC